MKKIQIQVPFEEEKFSALKLYLDQKGVLVDDALAQMVESLYEKTVPAGVRDYINLRAGITDTPPAKKRRTKPNASNPAGGGMCGGRREGRFGELGRGKLLRQLQAGERRVGCICTHLFPHRPATPDVQGVFALLKVENQGGLLSERA